MSGRREPLLGWSRRRLSCAPPRPKTRCGGKVRRGGLFPWWPPSLRRGERRGWEPQPKNSWNRAPLAKPAWSPPGPGALCPLWGSLPGTSGCRGAGGSVAPCEGLRWLREVVKHQVAAIARAVSSLSPTRPGGMGGWLWEAALAAPLSAGSNWLLPLPCSYSSYSRDPDIQMLRLGFGVKNRRCSHENSEDALTQKCGQQRT